MLYYGPTQLTMHQMLQMYSLHNGWGLTVALIWGALVFGIIGFIVGLAVAAPRPSTPKPDQKTMTPHQAA